MPKFVIERDLPGAGELSDAALRDIAKASNGVLCDLGHDIQWLHSYVTTDKIYCVYVAPSEDLIRQHGAKGGFPVTEICKVTRVIDPTTAEGI